MTMMRWEPFRDMVTLRNAMDRLFEESFVRPSLLFPESVGEFAVDMFQTDNDVIIKAALPGIRPEDTDISISGDMVTIKAERKEDQEVKEEDYLYKEHRYGSFTRTITLPMSVQTGKAEANFEDGMLTLRLPKAEEVKPKQIKIKTTKQIGTSTGRGRPKQPVAETTK